MHAYHPIGEAFGITPTERVRSGRAGNSVDADRWPRAKVADVRTEGGENLLLCVSAVKNQEVRTLMTVVAMGAAHSQKCIIPTPVATG